jgi:2-octaprenyl-6-methoxyphenol hydroxylase
VGGGPVGMALALALREYEFSILLLEARGLPEKVDDPRPLALSYGSHLILRRLGIWEDLLQPTPITTIHISNFGHFGQTILTPDDAGVAALGYVVNYHDLYHSMHLSRRSPLRHRSLTSRMDRPDKYGLNYWCWLMAGNWLNR